MVRIVKPWKSWPAEILWSSLFKPFKKSYIDIRLKYIDCVCTVLGQVDGLKDLFFTDFFSFNFYFNYEKYYHVWVSGRPTLSFKMYEHSLGQCLVSSQHHLWALVHRPRQQRGVQQNSQAGSSTVCSNNWLLLCPPPYQLRTRGRETWEGVGAVFCTTSPKK